MTQGERIMKLETEVAHLSTAVDSMNKKLDELLTLKHKGAGAVRLVMIILGTGVLGAVGTFLDWWKR